MAASAAKKLRRSRDVNLVLKNISLPLAHFTLKVQAEFGAR